MSDNNGYVGWKGLYMSTKDPHRGLLSSPSQHFDWRPQEAIVAHCGYAHDLRMLDYKQCTCGIYAARTIHEALTYVDHGRYHGSYGNDYQMPVLAQVALWGTFLIEGSTGFRAEKAYPKTIYVPPAGEAHVEKLRELYQVPVMVSDELFIDPKKNQLVTKTPTIDLSKVSQAEIDRAIRNKKRHQLYMKIRNTQKTLDVLKERLKKLPAEIRFLEDEINRMHMERDSL